MHIYIPQVWRDVARCGEMWRDRRDVARWAAQAIAREC